MMEKNLELLFDYTKFHIGVYLTLTTAYIAVATTKSDRSTHGFLVKPNPVLGPVAVFFFLLAGLAGGIIVSSITQTEKTNSGDFLTEVIGPWHFKLFPALTWTWIEHTSFWLGLLAAIFSLYLPDFDLFGAIPRKREKS